MRRRYVSIFLIIIVFALHISCGGNGGGEFVPTYTVGGSVDGLLGSGLILQNNGGDDLSINAKGSFTFITALANGAGYDVTVFTPPTNPGQNCTINNGSGFIPGANVTSVTISCSTILGESCTNGTECLSGQCVESVCCDSTCSGICETCVGASPGTCGFRPASYDCGTCARCNGAGSCVFSLDHLDCGLCEKCVALGTCGFQTSSEDLKNECPGNCDGAGICQ